MLRPAKLTIFRAGNNAASACSTQIDYALVAKCFEVGLVTSHENDGPLKKH